MSTESKSTKKSTESKEAVQAPLEERVDVHELLAFEYGLDELVKAGFVASLEGKTLMRRTQFTEKLKAYMNKEEV